MQLLLFSYAISFDVKNVPTVVLDPDQTAASRAYVQSVPVLGLLRGEGSIADLAEIDDAFQRNLAQVAVVIPPGFARARRGEKAQVAVLVDGTEPNAAQLGQAYAIALNQLYATSLAEWADRQGLDTTQLGRLEPRVRTWYNPERQSADFLIPGLMVVIIMIVTVQQTAVTLVRERDLGTQEQMMVSPLRLPELMLGKLLPWTLLAFVDMMVIALGGTRALPHPAARQRRVAGGLGGVVRVRLARPGRSSSRRWRRAWSRRTSSRSWSRSCRRSSCPGFAFPLESIPRLLQAVSYLFPARYMIVISRGVFLKGAGFAELWPQLALLAGYSTLVIVIASVLYGRRAAR